MPRTARAPAARFVLRVLTKLAGWVCQWLVGMVSSLVLLGLVVSHVLLRLAGGALEITIAWLVEADEEDERVERAAQDQSVLTTALQRPFGASGGREARVAAPAAPYGVLLEDLVDG